MPDHNLTNVRPRRLPAVPAPLLDTCDFVDWCRRDRPRTYDYIRRWDILYRHCHAEYCTQRQEAFAAYYGKPITQVNSIELCLAERYTACVNFDESADGLRRHVCDILPIIIGSELDRQIRAEFWRADRTVWCEDELKIGLLIQNKNVYNFTTTMATNPKVAHIYRRSNKQHRLDSRVYYYDDNFRGNMFYFEQALLLMPCFNCMVANDDPGAGACACQGPMCIVVDELLLRNCFKQDHLVIRRFCCVPGNDPQPASAASCHRHEAAVPILLQYFQQRDKNNGTMAWHGPLSLRDVLQRFGECGTFFPRFAGGARLSDVAFEEDLAAFIAQYQPDPTKKRQKTGRLSCSSQERIHIRLTNERDMSRLLLCDCPPSVLHAEFTAAVLPHSKAGSAMPPFTSAQTFWRLDNIDEFQRISDACFPRWTTRSAAHVSCADSEGYYDQLFVLYTYMREVMLRNEDIDQLSNKCVFDGSYLYNKLMQQIREYLCYRFSVQDLYSDWVDTLIARYRELAHTGNLYMLISSKTNIRIDMANDLKRSLKLSIKREKMQQTDCSLSSGTTDMRDTAAAGINSYMSNAALNFPAPTSTFCGKFPFTRSAMCPPIDVIASQPTWPRKTEITAGEGNEVSENHQATRSKPALPCGLPAVDRDTNDKCDFVIKRCRSSKFRNLYTGRYPLRTPETIMVASCNSGDINARQLIAYDSQHLLQNVASAHFSDLEFVFEQVKRPRVTNQQNSSKCAMMPRQSTRFLSAYNIGNMSVAGRTMNVCSRNAITFFVKPNGELCDQYYRWFDCVYALLRGQTASNVCQKHRLSHCGHCFLRLMINEVPYANVMIDKYYELSLFVLTKYWWPAAQFYRKTSHIISVTLISGVIVVPMTLVFDDQAVVRIDKYDPQLLRYDCWLFCPACQLYFPRFTLDRSSNLFFIDARRAKELRAFRTTYLAQHQAFLLADGGVFRCDNHTWFSPNDMQYYTSMLDSQVFSGRNESAAFYLHALTAPFFYEMACHGLFLNGKFVDATDISKLTVSINASKRRLRLRSSMFSDRLETLMDQNSRMYVNDARLPANAGGQFHEPRDTILGVPGQNSFRCCFMFGDFRGRNCEDAYVFDRQSRPRLVNTIQLKVNYYLNDSAVIDTTMLRFHFSPSIAVHTGTGCTFFFGCLISPCSLSFGSTFVHVKTVRIADLWIYKFYYTNWSSYLREGEMIFMPCSSKPAAAKEPVNGLQLDKLGRRTDGLDVPYFHPDRIAPRVMFDHRTASDTIKNQPVRSKKNSASSGALSGVNRIICEHACVTQNGRIYIEMQMTSRQLRFVVTLRDIHAIQKLQNNCGQKGVTSYEDLSDLYTSRGGKVHVIVSLYSMNGRQLLSQLLEQYSNAGTAYSYQDSLPLMSVHSRRLQGRQVGWAGYGEFFFSCDSPHENIIVSSPNFGNNAMRMCNMTYFAAIGNNLSTWIANRSADHVNYRNNPINGMPLNVYHCLSVYHYYSRQLYPRVLLTRELRKRLRDWVEMRKRGVMARLPLSLRFTADRLSSLS